jgi:myo-inositol 2-dehydrogenase/D-chiro-inositol 1-dehydrogenase
MPSPGAPSPTLSPELRVGIIGVGMMGSFHARLLSRVVRGTRVSVVCDADHDRARAIADKVGARIVEDPFEVVAAEDVDAVVIATPGTAHEKQVRACIDREIPVLCEKPLAMEPQTAYELVRAERALGRDLVQVGFMRRFDPEYVELRAAIAAGELGNPLMLHCVHRNADAPEFFDSAMMIYDSVVHEVDVVRFLLDEEIVAVTVMRPTASHRAPLGVSDPMMVLMETASGRLADVEIFVRTGVGYEVRTEVVGEAGSALIGLAKGLTRTASDGRRSSAITQDFVARFALAYQGELQAWAEAARRGTIAGPGAWDGYASLAVCAAGVEALRSGRRSVVAMEARP